jgi:hypothetical protein
LIQNRFAGELIAKANTLLLFFIQQMNAFRVDGTYLRFAVLDSPESVLKLRGIRFDKVWWMGQRSLEYRQLVQVTLLRLGNGNENNS